jgi:hypothetical protein
MTLTKQDLEDFVGRFERAAASSRGSLSPALVSEWDKHIKQIPLLAQRIEAIQVDSDKVDGIIKEVAVIQTKQDNHTKTIDNAFRWIWGLVASFVVLAANAFLK